MNLWLKMLLLSGLVFSQACSPSPPVEQSSTQPSNSSSIYSASETSTSGRAIITADESIQPIVETAIESFEMQFPEASIEARYLPGEEAIREMLLNDSVRLVVACRRLTPEEEAILTRRNINPNYADILREGIVLVVNAENPVTQLNRSQLLDVLTGRIQQWQEINPEAPEGEIVAVFDHAESSTIRFLQDSILAGQNLLKKRYAQTPTSAVFDYVRQQPLALGVVGLAWISDQDDPQMRMMESGTKRLKLEKPTENTPCAYEQTYFGPYQSYLDQRCYPLNRTVNTILREVVHGVGTGFVSFLDGPDGQRLIHKSGLAALHTIPRRVKFPPIEGAKDIRATD
jgi:phosphate transport system substrate-binding protein